MRKCAEEKSHAQRRPEKRAQRRPEKRRDDAQKKGRNGARIKGLYGAQRNGACENYFTRLASCSARWSVVERSVIWTGGCSFSGVLFREPSRQRKLRRRGPLSAFPSVLTAAEGLLRGLSRRRQSTFLSAAALTAVEGVLRRLSPSAAELTEAEGGPSEDSSLSVSSLSLSVSYDKTTFGAGRFKNGISSGDISFRAALLHIIMTSK